MESSEQKFRLDVPEQLKGIKLGDVIMGELCDSCNGCGAHPGVPKPDDICEDCNGSGGVLTAAGRLLMDAIGDYGNFG